MAFGYCHRLRLRVCVSVCVYQSRACLHDNSSLIQARITKFGPEMLNTLVWVPIGFDDDRPWPSRSNLTWNANFTSFWACSHHNSSAVQAKITKFGPKTHLSTVEIPINFGLDWFWSSLSFPILKPIFLPNLFALFLYCIYWDPSLVNISETIAGDWSNQMGFWLNISFVVNYRRAFRSKVAIAIDLWTSEDRYFLWITAVALPRRCL